MSSKTVLLVCPDILPLPGLPTTGAGLRAWGIGKGLESRGYEVIFSMPRACLAMGYEIPSPFADRAWEMTDLDSLVRSTNPDIAVFFHWPTVLTETKLQIPTVLDFHGPHIIEREYQGFGERAINAWQKIAAIRKADFFTCAGEKQRLYFLGWLAAAGIPSDSLDVAVVPVCLSPQLPDHEWHDDEPTFVYGGVSLPWQDPSVGIRTLIQCMERHGRGRLKIFGGRHPTCAEDMGKYDGFRDLGDDMARSSRVERLGFVTHDRLIEEYCRAHVALDVMGRNVERELALTTRTVEYMWCGLPVIYQDYSDLSDLIRSYQAGWVVDPTDATQVTAAIEEVLTSPAEVRRRGGNAHRLARERLTWDEAVEPLDRFCCNPRRIDPLPMPMWDRNPKGLPALMKDVVHNLRRGGVGAVAHFATRYIKRQIAVTQEQEGNQ